VAARGRRAAKCEAIRFAASRPPNVPIGDIVVRPTRQVYL
jgi:NADP-dependent 3-hydroxy acid dehydrogenase YdfG